MQFSIVREVVLAMALGLCTLASGAFAKSTDATVDADTAACTQAKDNKACWEAYAYLLEKIGAATNNGDEALLSRLRSVAEAGCAAGNGSLCNRIGFSISRGDYGWAQDGAQALRYFEQACSLGNAVACGNAGISHQEGKGVPVDRAAAGRLYEKGCRLGDMTPCQMQAGWLLHEGVAGAPKAVESVASMRANCADRALNGPSCVALGVAYFRASEGLARNENEAGKYWSKACREIRDAPACYYVGLKSLRDTTISKSDHPAITAGVLSVIAACQFGHTLACEYAVPAFAKTSLNYPSRMTEARYWLCVQKPTREDCEFAAHTYATATGIRWESPYGVHQDYAKATFAWLTACRKFGTHCVDAANMHLKARAPALNSPTLAIGILEAACAKGDAPACKRKAEVIAEFGGVTGSYIDPMVSDDERFLLAKFEIENGDLQRGRETLQWLAYMGHTDAELELAIAYLNGMFITPVPVGQRWEPELPLYRREEVMYGLFERAASKGIPEAAMRIAVRKYEENDNEGADSYQNAIARALYLGADGANEFYAAAIAKDKARIAARTNALVEMNRRNVKQRNNMDRETVQRAWDQYAARRQEEEKRAGGTVCGVVYGQGNSRYRTCMTRDHAAKYYRGSF